MTAGKVSRKAWMETVVLIRSDLYDEAERQHHDISFECNTALASRLGIAHTGSRLQGAGETLPVISGIEPKPAGAMLRPVINADDPSTPAKVKKEKKEAAPTKPRPVRLPAAAGTSALSKQSTPIVPSSPTGTSGKPASDRKKKAGAIKKFVSTRIVRTDDDGRTDAIIPKDELYQRFERWCREHAVHPVPDRRSFTVALKNQCAIPERSIGGMPCWVNIRLK